jgi:hypothetical protein
VCRAPEPRSTRGDRGELSGLSVRPFAALPQGRGVRCPRLPSSGSRITIPRRAANGWLKWTSVPPFDKGWLVVQTHVHKSTLHGCGGRARSCSIVTEGAEVLPRWDPSTCCPCRP